MSARFDLVFRLYVGIIPAMNAACHARILFNELREPFEELTEIHEASVKIRREMTANGHNVEKFRSLD